MKKISHMIGLVVLLAALACPILIRPASASPSATFVINTNVDAPDSNLADGICYNTVLGNCTLRAAIAQAFSVSNSGSPVSITFHSDVYGQTFYLGNSGLGTLAWAASYVTLDGSNNQIIIDGSTLAAGLDVFSISGSHNTLKNLTIRNAPGSAVKVGDLAGVGEGNFNLIDHMTLLGSGASGVYVYGGSSGGTDNAVRYSLIGLSAPDLSACQVDQSNRGHGVFISAGAHRTQVLANKIACNAGDGVSIFSGATAGSPPVLNTEITDNFIGIGNVSPLPNQGIGVIDWYGAFTVLDSNNIAYNQQGGVLLLGASNAAVMRNQVRWNGLYGIEISTGASGNVIGSTGNPLLGNTISGNQGCGVRIQGGSNGNVLDGNWIGTDSSGLFAVPNQLSGVCIFNSDNNNVGTSLAGLKQIISGNLREGVYIENASGNFVGQTNWIGLAANGSGALGNGLEGVFLTGASNTSVFPEFVVNNGLAGIGVEGDTATGNLIAPLNIHHNGHLPIDLNNDGATANGSHSLPGPNNWLAYPICTGLNIVTQTIGGTTCNNCTVKIYRAIGNPRSAGGGGVYLTETTANATGQWVATLPASALNYRFSFVAVKPGAASLTGDSSEMSPATATLYLAVGRK